MIEWKSAKSLCEPYAKIVVSKDARSRAEHIAKNSGQKYYLRHYRLDGAIVSGETCCDFLLLNDTLKKAYYIELKGRDIRHGVEQLEAAEKLMKSRLTGYESNFRLIYSKAATHDIRSNKFRSFLDRVGNKHFIYKTVKYEEEL